jgi:hypothetical protein
MYREHSPHGTAYELTVECMAGIGNHYQRQLTNDKDGMADDWEVKKGLDPANAADASQYKLDKNYTILKCILIAW